MEEAPKAQSWFLKSPLAPFLSVISAVANFFLAEILGINAVAFFLAMRGWSLIQIQDWVFNDIVGQFANRLAVALIGIGLVAGLLNFIKMSWAEIGLVRPKAQDICDALIGFGWYLLLHFGVFVLVGALVPAVNLDQQQQLGFSTETTGVALVFIFISLVILPPLYEEILTRGFLLRGLRSRLSLPVAGIITSVLFAAAHLQWNSGEPLLWVAAIDTFVLSLVLVRVRIKTGSLWPAILLHALKNLLAFLQLFIFKV